MSATAPPIDFTEEPATTRRGRPRDARCDHAIQQATLDLLTEGGVANLSIDAVAARAGVGKATIYRRWSSKEALVLEALCSDSTSTIATPDTGTLRADLEQYFDVLIERFQANRRSDVLPHLIAAACYDDEVRDALDQYISSRQTPMRIVLQRAVQRGELDADTDLDVLVDVLVGPVLYRRLLTGAEIDGAFVRTVLDFLL